MSIDIELAKRLNTIVSQRGFTVKEFSELLNVPSPNMSGYLNGKRPIGLKILNKIKDVFPLLNMNWLLYNEGQPGLSETADQVCEGTSAYGKPNSIDDLINSLVEKRMNDLESKIDKKIEELKVTLLLGDEDSEMIEKLKEIITKNTH